MELTQQLLATTHVCRCIHYTHYSSLTNAQMCVNGGIAGSASQVFILPVGYVLMRACITVLLGQAEVYDIDKVALLAEPHQEVVRFDVSVNKVL